jgi:hypothetical protein
MEVPAMFEILKVSSPTLIIWFRLNSLLQSFDVHPVAVIVLAVLPPLIAAVTPVTRSQL